MAKITGFNDREQRLFDVLSDGKYHTIAELKKVFSRISKAHLEETYEQWDESDQDAQAQSFVRNGLRRLVRDGWVDGPHTNSSLPRGTYALSRTGKERIKRGTTETTSARTRRSGKAKKKVKAAPKKSKPADASLLKGVEKATAKQVAKEKAQAARKRAEAAVKREAAAEKSSNGKKAPAKKKSSAKSKTSTKPKKSSMLSKALDEIKTSVGEKKKNKKAVARAKAQEAAKKATEAAAVAAE